MKSIPIHAAKADAPFGAGLCFLWSSTYTRQQNLRTKLTDIVVRRLTVRQA